jgi:hypothetical protein
MGRRGYGGQVGRFSLKLATSRPQKNELAGLQSDRSGPKNCATTTAMRPLTKHPGINQPTATTIPDSRLNGRNDKTTEKEAFLKEAEPGQTRPTRAVL